MLTFLHSFRPSPILISFGPVHIYWYGFFIVVGVLSALTVAMRLGKLYGIKIDAIIDLAFWLVIGGLIGARLYDVLLNWQYFLSRPLDILKIWQGGLAIHGALMGGIIALWLYARKNQGNFWQHAAIIATVLPLAQAIGRWGNYFNQELFGKPTNLPWGIPIDINNRPLAYFDSAYFHPTFIYESLGNLFIFIILISLQIYWIKKPINNKRICFSAQGGPASGRLLLDPRRTSLGPVASYFLLYSLLRFFMEFLRIDSTPVLLGLRFPQLVSLLIIFACLAFWITKLVKKSSQNPTLDK